MSGPIALVGSGGYTEPLLDVERGLIAGRPPRYVQIPTAAAPEGPQRLRYWLELGRDQAERIGVSPVPLIVTNRDEANDPAIAAEVAGAGLVCLSGGDAVFLADTLRDTLLWQAVVDAWHEGAALAGCAAGAVALGHEIVDPRRPLRDPAPGLGLLPGLRVLPGFDRVLARLPDVVLRPFTAGDGERITVGIDADTALVGGGHAWTVRGRGSVRLFGQGGRRDLRAGDTLRFGDVARR
ncbi:MAG TPA: Type 1 glutamine amidotransferase-like domain-containing protein [Micromonosporaceae bacterium]